MKVLDRLRLAADVLRHGATMESDIEAPLRPLGDPWDIEANAATRASAALAVLDEDVVGFYLVLFRAGPTELRCRGETAYVLQPDWWPAIAWAVDAEEW